MPDNRIIIHEVDHTSLAGEAVSSAVVFIPGFATKGTAGQLVRCDSVDEFTEAFGDTAPTFAEEQAYPTGDSGFADNAIPKDDTKEALPMFKSGAIDPSYFMAKQLLAAGMSVLYVRVNESVSVANMYTFLKDCYTYNFSNINDYDVTFLTSGGYPVLEYSSDAIVKEMLKAAYSRGDVTCLIDHTNNAARALTGDTSVFKYLTDHTFDYGSYGTCMTPWRKYKPAGADVIELPASYVYLIDFAASVQNNPAWLAIAGVTRGLVKDDAGTTTAAILTNAIADAYQPDTGVSMNAITNIRPYGPVIWGNRTLRDNDTGLSALSFLNLRILTNEVKKVLYSAATSCMFEQNSSILWINFKAKITPTLDQMATGYGISKYTIRQEATADKSKLKATIILYPIYAVDKIELTVVLTDDEVSVS